MQCICSGDRKNPLTFLLEHLRLDGDCSRVTSHLLTSHIKTSITNTIFYKNVNVNFISHTNKQLTLFLSMFVGHIFQSACERRAASSFLPDILYWPIMHQPMFTGPKINKTDDQWQSNLFRLHFVLRINSSLKRFSGLSAARQCSRSSSLHYYECIYY